MTQKRYTYEWLLYSNIQFVLFFNVYSVAASDGFRVIEVLVSFYVLW